MNSIGDYKIPEYVTDQNNLEILIENTKKMDKETTPNQISKCDFYIKICNDISIIGARLKILIQSNSYMST